MKNWEEEMVTREKMCGPGSGHGSMIGMNDYDSQDYVKPPVKDGYEHIDGEWYNGFVIERHSDKSQFVWIPVESLNSNGMFGKAWYGEKFGRRIYQIGQTIRSLDYAIKLDLASKFSKFHEQVTDELALQYESIKKYGGFYISRYNISQNNKNGKPQSIKGETPWTSINFYDAKKLATTVEESEELKSHMIYGAEYDSVLEWFINSGARTRKEVCEDSTEWGNCFRRLAKTGSSEKWCTNNIYDFAGNVSEWTQEQRGREFRVIRGGNYCIDGSEYPVSYRDWSHPSFDYDCVGFRVALYIR